MSDKVSDILERAADLIEPEGRWTQHVYARGKSGKEVHRRQSATCFCLLGSVDYAAGFDPGLEYHAPLSWLHEVIPFANLADWNDEEERTQAEVVAKLREAAAKAREQGK